MTRVPSKYISTFSIPYLLVASMLMSRCPCDIVPPSLGDRNATFGVSLRLLLMACDEISPLRLGSRVRKSAKSMSDVSRTTPLLDRNRECSRSHSWTGSSQFGMSGFSDVKSSTDLLLVTP